MDWLVPENAFRMSICLWLTVTAADMKDGSTIKYFLFFRHHVKHISVENLSS